MLQRTKSKKIQQWTTKDVVLNVITYVFNVVFIIALFILAGYLTGKLDYVLSPKTALHYTMLISMIFGIVAVYFVFEDRDFLKNPANSEMLFLIVELSLIVCFATGEYVDPYLRPVALVSLLTLFLSNRRTAVFMNIIFCIIIFLLDSFIGGNFELGKYPMLIICFSSGLLAVFLMDKVHSRLKLLLLGFLTAIPALVCIGLALIDGSEIQVVRSLVCGGCSGILSVAVFMVFLPLFENMFKKVSCFKFAELTEHRAKLIRKMIKNAPGTFNHSIVVSNIAESCASAIGEDALLARTCAYYHDIGKLRRPEFFKENQADNVNPHDDLTPELSANIIRSHTQDGYNLIMKSRLPKEIADVCLQHHGTLPILYFYDKAKKFTDGEVDLMQYCYVGPKPRTKIAAIIMIADGCEAAARSLQDRSRENVKKVVRNIVNERMQLGQFEDCEITLKELNIIIHTVVNNLTGIYHNRIEYPKVSLDGMEM